MLYPTMPLSELEIWAEQHNVEYALAYPAKMLLVPTSKIHTNWLWVFKQNNTTIREIITRTTAHTIEETNAETAPLEFQQAAIHYLEEMVKNTTQALQDEQELLSRAPPSDTILHQIWNNALRYRSQLRQRVSPRSRKDRRTQKLWLDSKHQHLLYKEETIAWCGGGSWAELVVHLDGRKQMVTCKCLNGKRGLCRLGLSAIDQTLEMLSDPAREQIHKRLIKNIGTPKWEKDLELLDETLEQKDIARPGEALGWRINETKQGLTIEAVWCLHSSTGWKHRKVDATAVIQHGSRLTHASDLPLLHLSKQFTPSMQGAMLRMLQSHPRVFVGSRSSELGIIQQNQFTLAFEQNDLGIEWSLRLMNEEIAVQNIIQFHQLAKSGIWYKISKNRFTYVIISNRIQALILNIAKTSKIIPKEGISGIYQRLIQIENILPIHLSEPLRGTAISPDSRPIIRLSISDQSHLRIEFTIRPHGDKIFSVGKGTEILYFFNKEKQLFGNCRRDLMQEKSHALSLQQLLGLEPTSDYKWVLTNSSKIFQMLGILKGLPNTHHHRIEWLSKEPSIQHIGIEDLNIDVFNNEHQLEIKGCVEGDKESLDLWEVLPAIRNNTPYMLVKGHVWYSITDDFRSRIRTLADIIDPRDNTLCIPNSHLVTLTNILSHKSIDMPIVLQERMRSLQSIILQDTAFAYTLRSYQIDGVKWMLNVKQWTSGCLLADEMGLGKTIQTIRFLHENQYFAKNKTLIVAPKSTSGNWLHELQKCLSGWHIVHYQGSKRQDLLSSNLPKQCLILTYDILVRDIDLLIEHHYSTIIFDEAQNLKNPQSSRVKSAKLLTTDFTIALTGTPIENSLLDLWSIFSVITPKHLGTWALFKKRFVHPIEQGHSSRLQDLKKLIQPLILRRQKEDVVFELPPKIELNELIPLSTFERDTYNQLRAKAKRIIHENPQQAKFLVLSLLTKLRQVCCHRKLVLESASNHSSKLDRALEIVENLHQNKRKVLVFSQFVRLLQLFKEQLIKSNMEFCYLDGSTPSQQRQSEIDRFQNTDVSIFLISLKAGGSGINLTKATEVIHLDPWWNPAVEDQASDRAHRIGQTQTVTVIRLVAENSIETQILKLQEEKRRIASDLLSDSISKLSIEDISLLLE